MKLTYDDIRDLLNYEYWTDEEIVTLWNEVRDAEERIYSKAEFSRVLEDYYDGKTPLEILQDLEGQDIDWSVKWFRDCDWMGLASDNDPLYLLDEEDLIYSIVYELEKGNDVVTAMVALAISRTGN